MTTQRSQSPETAPWLTSLALPPRAMVLAAGLGTRLRPLTDRLPKPLVPLLGLPLIAYNLLLLRSLGVREVVVNLHYHGEAIRAALGDGSSLGLALHYSVEEELLGTGGGIRRALPWLAAHGTFVVCNGDTIVDGDLAGAWARHQQRGAAATLLLHRHVEAARHGAIGLDATGQITAIGNLLGPRSDSSLLFAGVHFIEPHLLASLAADVPACVIRQGYVPALQAQERICGDPVIEFWADLGTPARYLDAVLTLLARPELCRHARPGQEGTSTASALPQGTLVPPLWLGPEVRLEGPATLGPEVALGAGVTVAAGARAQRCVVWPGARLAGTRRDGILLDDGTWVAVPGE